MNYSYIMGINNIEELKNNGFIIQDFKEEYGVSFPDEKKEYYEEFIRRNLSNGFWNEYLGSEKVFIFKFDDGSIKRYTLNYTNENEVLNLCRKFANCNFESIDQMLKDNEYYLENYYK